MIAGRLTSVIVAVLLSASTALAGALDEAVAAKNRKDYATAVALVQPLAEQGDALAQYYLGDIYLWGFHDWGEATKWFRKAAEQGHARGEVSFGNTYLHSSGDDAPEDWVEAVKWFRKAAEQGDARGQEQLGEMYKRGQGVPQDYVLAHMWLNLAGAHSYPTKRDEPADQERAVWAASIRTGQGDRDELAVKMTPEQIAEAQRLAREWKPTK
jgi:TPR repeat protein